MEERERRKGGSLLVSVRESKRRGKPSNGHNRWNADGIKAKSVSFQDLVASSRSGAYELRSKYSVRKGDRVLLVFPPGLDFVRAFLSCLYAGAIAVPVYPPGGLLSLLQFD